MSYKSSEVLGKHHQWGYIEQWDYEAGKPKRIELFAYEKLALAHHNSQTIKQQKDKDNEKAD